MCRPPPPSSQLGTHLRAKNKRAALQCLKKKKLIEGQADAIANSIMRMEEQKIMCEGLKATAETASVLKESAAMMKVEHKKGDLASIQATMDEIGEQADNMREIQDVMATPLGGTEIDDDELDKELEDLEAEDLDAALLQPGVPATKLPAAAAATPAMPAVPAGKAKAPPAKVSSRGPGGGGGEGRAGVHAGYGAHGE